MRSCVGRPTPPSAPPVTRWLGGTVRKVEDTQVEVDYQVRPDMLNPYGLLHGGIMCAMLDDVIGMAGAISSADGQYVSLNMSVDYVGKVKGAGAVVTVSAEVIRVGRRAAYLQATIYGQRRAVIARASSNLINLSL